MKRPTWKPRHPPAPPRRPASRPPGMEPLEHRHLLSVALAEIDSTVPADGAALLAPPQQFTINFDPGLVNQVDDLFGFGPTPSQTFPMIIGFDNDNLGDNREFEVDRVGAGGVTTALLGGATSTPLQGQITTATDPDGTTTQSQLILTPPAGTPSLLPGTYQIELEPGTTLDGVFSLIDPSPAWTASQTVTIAQFTVLGQGATTGDAADLGDIGPSSRIVSGSVDPQGSQGQVAVYQFTLPQGNRWLLNAQVLAQAVGSPLQAGLALFDSNGNLWATRNSGQGMASDPNDPFLTLGLPPGTYYLGVSAAGNLPGWPDGYDLAAGTPGTAGFDEAGGPFQLEVSATPVVTTTTLTSDGLEYGDPIGLDPSPTGLDLTFSGPVNASPLFVPDQQESALAVVNTSGQVWPITAVNYQNSTNSLNFIFDEPLPAGSYSLIEPAQGGLTDPSGQPVVVPAGNPPGVLARWTVAAMSGPSDPDDLGVVWPGPVNVTWNSAIARTTELAAGQETTYQFVTIVPGIYKVETQIAGGPIDLEVTGADGTTVLDAQDLSGLHDSLMTLGTGVYSMTLTAEGSQPAIVQWTLKPIALDYEKILENGVGQTSVATLSPTGLATGGLVGPMANTGAVSAVTSTTSTASISPGSGLGNGPGSNPTTFTTSPIPAGLLVSMNTGLMGLPGANTQDVAAVGPMAEGALTAVADRVHGLLPGITYLSRSDSEAKGANGDPPDILDPANGPMTEPRTTVSLADTPANPEVAIARNDARALGQADRLVRMATWIEGLLGFRSGSEPATPAGADGRAIVAGLTLRGEAESMRADRALPARSVRGKPTRRAWCWATSVGPWA